MEALAVFEFSEQTVFPGPAALIPCVGTALVIVGGRIENPVSRILGMPALRGAGLISYSLYLWHFPLIVFFRHLIVRPFTGLEAGLLLVTSVALAALTWRFVEQPFRQTPRRILRPVLYRYAGVAMVGSIVVGLFTDFSDGAAFRLSPLARTYLEADDDKDSSCVRLGEGCFLGDESVEPRYVVWGDSHGGAILPAFKQLTAESGIPGRATLRGGCVPLVGYRFRYAVISRSCAAHVKQTMQELLDSRVDTVFLVTRWTMLVEESMYRYESGRALILIEEDQPDPRKSNLEVLRVALDRTLQRLRAAGIETVIICCGATGVHTTDEHADVRDLTAAAQWLTRIIELAAE